MTTDYEQFGPEWEKEISKLPKKVLISMLKAKAIKILELEELESKLKKIDDWCSAYPFEAYPEPDFRQAIKVLKENGMSLGAISASNFRHVLDGVKAIIDEDIPF